MNKRTIILLLLSCSLTLSAKDIIRTSFEVSDGYPAGSLSNTNAWKVSKGLAAISNDADNVHSGSQALVLTTNDKLQVGHIPYSSAQTGLSDVTYIDMYLCVRTQPSSNLSLTAYDLTGNHRSAMVDLTSAGKIKVYNGSSGYATQPSYVLNQWLRICLRIDHVAQKYQFALNGQVWPQDMNFREIKNGATDVDYHELRFSQSSGNGQIAIDDLVISTDSIDGIYFPPLVSPTPSDDSTTTPVVPTPEPAVPQTRRVSTSSELKTALGAMNPGDSIIIADGDYTIGGVTIRRPGTEQLPIVIIAEHSQQARIIGNSSFTLRYVAYLELNGLDIDVAHTSTIIKMEGCNHVRVTNCKMTMAAGAEGKTSKWILIGDVYDEQTCISHHNRIDHNIIYDKLDGGAWVVIDGTHGTPHISQHDRIDHNIFRNNTPRMENEKETIRMGVSDLSNLNAYTVVEENTFEDCDGDPEIVSVKSCADTVRNNTFIRCLGTICLRQGWNSVVTGNRMDGEHKTAIYDGASIGCGGVRVYGKGHEICHNSFCHLSGNRWDAAITLTNGDVANTGAATSSHPIPENVNIHHNTFIDNVSNVEIGFTNNSKYGKKPLGCSFHENVFYGTDSLVTYHSSMNSSNVLWYNNSLISSGTALPCLEPTSPSPCKVIINNQFFILLPDRQYTILGL